MTRTEALVAVVVGLVVMTVGLVWLFGAWPLVAVGAVVILAALLLPTAGAPAPTPDTDPDEEGTGS
ncbi:hypothetical protein [Nocardiopsis sp. NPDC057823]|uniref:hypothetical protein n=1 Tax=Nocardiopsis sp. NPDC057823 TaxID=3346256 RepID=UPI00366C9CC6